MQKTESWKKRITALLPAFAVELGNASMFLPRWTTGCAANLSEPGKTFEKSGFDLQHFLFAIRYLCRKGAKPLWEELYEDHYKELVAYGARMSGSKELAEDLVQETFVKALMNTETIEELSSGKQRAWLYRTFKNLFFDRCRRAILENEYEQSWHPECLEDPGIQEIENAMLLQNINPQDRVIF